MTINLPDKPGVYLFKDRQNKIIYVGKAINLKKRVKSYFQIPHTQAKVQALVHHIHNTHYIVVESEFEALLLEANLIKKYRPKYNVVLKDDKHYIYIKITAEEFPRILYARRNDEKKATYFGPFPSATTVRVILGLLRKIFPFCIQPTRLKRACLYHHIGLCDPCPAEVKKLPKEKYDQEKRRYRRNISLLKMIFNGKVKSVKDQLSSKMQQDSEGENYEKAAETRDKLEKLDYLARNYHQPENYLKDPDNIIQIRKNEQESLRKILSNYFPLLGAIKKIECYDISNISGRLATGSLVTFIDGDPDKNFYRRFRIKTKSTPDDFAMLSEVLKRRLSHTDWPLPDLIIVDGGKPQVSTMSKILEDQNLTIPLVGLAKREEQIILLHNDNFVTLSLKVGSGALSLVQRLRDEAHRFAHKYHQLLRLKALIKT